MTASRRFLEELRRRGVIRVLVLYAIAGWVIIQVAATVLPSLNVPAWAVSLVIVLVALGLPLAAILAWAFELTSRGLRREVVPAAEGPAAPPLAQTPPAAAASSPPANATAVANRTRGSIAVLPFANLTGDSGKNFLGEGLAEELIHVLAGVPGLRVPSRTSSFAYRGRDVDLRRIANELEVSTVLEGSVRAAGERIRITAQLIDGHSGYHLWSQHYDRRFEDFFDLQDELASAIILQTLDVAMQGVAEVRGIRRDPPTRNLDAYLLYLGAASDLATNFNARPAFEKLQAALRLDPDFARARSFMVHVRVMGFLFGISLPGTLADAEQDAQRALESAPNSALTYLSLGIIRAAQGRWLEAESSFRRTKELDASEPEPWALHAAYVLGTTGHLRAAVASALEAVRLAPAHPIFKMNLAISNNVLGDDNEARALTQAAIELGLQPSSSPLVDTLSQLELRAGRYDSACNLMLKVVEGPTGAPHDSEAVELVFGALAGRRERSAAIRALGALRTGPVAQPQFMRRRMILWYSMLGGYDQAYEIVNESLDEFAATGTIGVAWAFLWMKELAGLRADPRFAALAVRMRLPEYWDRYGPPDGYAWHDGRLVAS